MWQKAIMHYDRIRRRNNYHLSRLGLSLLAIDPRAARKKNHKHIQHTTIDPVCLSLSVRDLLQLTTNLIID